MTQTKQSTKQGVYSANAVGQSKPLSASDVLLRGGAPDLHDPSENVQILIELSNDGQPTLDKAPEPLESASEPLKVLEREESVESSVPVVKAYPVAPPEPPPSLEEVRSQVIAMHAEDAVLSQAWDTLKQVLHPHVRTAIWGAAESQHLPEWQLVCGLIVHISQSSGLFSPIIDPSWRDLKNSERALIDFSAVCMNKQCGKKFVGKHRGQVYCSNECGVFVEEALFEKKRAAGELLKKQKMRLDMEELRQFEEARRAELAAGGGR